MTSSSDADEDMELLMRDYCMPTMAEMTTESLLTKSQYAKVIFHDLLASYPTDADVWCRYSVTEGVTVRQGDKVALFRVGWNSINEHLLAETAPLPERPEENEFQILFKADLLPKDTREFYQLCYVSVEGCVCGASVPIQFRRAGASELREIEEHGLVVVRSQTAIQADKLQQASDSIRALEEHNSNLTSHGEDMASRLDLSEVTLAAAHRDLLRLVAEKGALCQDNDRLTAASKALALQCEEKATTIAEMSTAYEGLKLENTKLALDSAEFRASSEDLVMRNAELTAAVDDLVEEKVRRERDVQILEWTITQNRSAQDTVQFLGRENARLSTELEETLRRDQGEADRLRDQLDGLQQMLDVSTQSKDVAVQALHKEQARVEELIANIANLHWVAEQQALRDARELKAALVKLENTEELVEKLTEQSTLDQSPSVAVASAFDPLLDEYEDMRRRVAMLAEENQALETTRRENKDLLQQLHQAAQESAGVSALAAENEALRAENGALARQLQQLRTSGALGMRRETDAVQGLATAAKQLAERDSEVAALLDENRLLILRTQEMQSVREAGTGDSLRGMASLVAANEELIAANEELMQTNAKLVQVLEAGDAMGKEPSQLHESRGCLDLSHAIKVMDLQNRKGDADLALADALAAESAAWDEVTLAQAQLQQLGQQALAGKADLDAAERGLKEAEVEAAKLAAAMKHLQEAILRHDADTDDAVAQADELRLEVLLQRWDALALRRARLDSAQHDLRQDAAVYADRRDALQARAAQADDRHKRALREKRRLLQTLVELDSQALALTGDGDALSVPQDLQTCLGEEERIVAVHDLEGEVAPSLASLNLTNVGWEVVSKEMPPQAEKALDCSGRQTDRDAELWQRLDLAAAEYRTLFLEKSRLEKQLANQTKHAGVLEKQLANQMKHLAVLEKELTNETKNVDVLEKQLANETKHVEELEEQLANQMKHVVELEKELQLITYS